MFNWNLRVPYGYQNAYRTLRQIEAILKPNYHPEYIRRFLAWAHYHNGYVGVGGHWRADGTQKVAAGFAPEGKSFHQNQRYNDGFIGACAIDTVIKDGPDAGDWHDGIPWSAVPIQGSVEARRWGVHANVGVPGNGESWHIQPVEIDGHTTFLRDGSPAPVANYPIPVEHDPYAAAEEAPVTYYFTTRAIPSPLWAVEGGKDGKYAVNVTPSEWVRRGQPTGERITMAQANQRYIFANPVAEGVVN